MKITIEVKPLDYTKSVILSISEFVYSLSTVCFYNGCAFFDNYVCGIGDSLPLPKIHITEEVENN